MDLSKRTERIKDDIMVLQKDFLFDLHRLLKIDFNSYDENVDSDDQDKIRLFLRKEYDFEKYDNYISELLQNIDDLEAAARRVPAISEELRATKKGYEDKKASLTDTNYELGLVRENYLAEVNSLSRELELSKNLDEELQKKIFEEDNRQKRKLAEINKLNLEIQNIKHRSVAQASLIKKGEIEKEAQITRLKKQLKELNEIYEDMPIKFEEEMEEKDSMIKDLNRKIVLIDKEIELLKDMESLKASKV